MDEKTIVALTTAVTGILFYKNYKKRQRVRKTQAHLLNILKSVENFQEQVLQMEFDAQFAEIALHFND